MDLIFLQSFQERINTLKIGIRSDLAEYYGVKNIIIYILASMLSEYLTEPRERGYVHYRIVRNNLFRAVPPKLWLLICTMPTAKALVESMMGR
jgi:hypothetical protein